MNLGFPNLWSSEPLDLIEGQPQAAWLVTQGGPGRGLTTWKGSEAREAPASLLRATSEVEIEGFVSPITHQLWDPRPGSHIPLVSFLQWDGTRVVDPEIESGGRADPH